MENLDSPIRKLITGSNPKDGMCYVVGGKAIEGTVTIKYILEKDGGYDIMVKNSRNEVYKWKHINSKVPTTVEYNTEL